MARGGGCATVKAVRGQTLATPPISEMSEMSEKPEEPKGTRGIRGTAYDPSPGSSMWAIGLSRLGQIQPVPSGAAPGYRKLLVFAGVRIALMNFATQERGVNRGEVTASPLVAILRAVGLATPV